jgi:hypothetical protein
VEEESPFSGNGKEGVISFRGKLPWHGDDGNGRSRAYRRKEEPDDVRVQVCTRCRLPDDSCDAHPECPWYSTTHLPPPQHIVKERARKLLKKWTTEDRLSRPPKGR